MKSLILILGKLILAGMLAWGQEYLVPSEGFKAFIVFPGYSETGAFDVHGDFLYACRGDTIYCLELETGSVMNATGLPVGYKDAFPSFLTVDPDGSGLWAGYTVPGNSDDRIYKLDLHSNQWRLMATMPGNFDMEFWNETPLVSGLNSSDWNAPSSIFALDTSGLNQHEKIVEIGGYAAGFALDAGENLYYGTSFAVEDNLLFRWDSADIASVLADPVPAYLDLEDGQKLSDFSGGAADCETDVDGNLVLSINHFSSDKIIAVWNGVSGDGIHLDTLCFSSEAGTWLGMVKSQGSISTPSRGNRIFTTSPGRAISEVHADYLPLLSRPLPLLSGTASSGSVETELDTYFTDPDDPDVFSFEVMAISNPSVATVAINGHNLVTDFLSPGQTNVFLKASNGGRDRMEKMVVGVVPLLEGNFELADFEDLEIEPESFWNGSDGSGHFTTGPVNFYNEYNPDWYSWNGWAYSNQTDNATAGFINQYSAITGSGFGDGSPEGGSYGVGYVFGPPVLDFTDTAGHQVAGFMVTNSTYAAYAMEKGDAFSKKFGGVEGSDPDFFRLMIWGRNHGKTTDTIAYYLADYRFDSDAMDYIIKTWQWVDLTALGRVDSLLFALESSDTGEWGMNTPGFFCIDNLHVIPNENQATAIPVGPATASEWSIYPNPGAGKFTIRSSSPEKLGIRVFNLNGTCIYQDKDYNPPAVIDLTGQPAGNYLFRIEQENEVLSRIIQKY